MKKKLTLALALALLLSLLSGCAGRGPSPGEAPSPTPTAEPTSTPAPERLSEKYVQWLQGGTYYYSLTADAGSYLIDVTCAGRNGDLYARMDAQNQPIRQMVLGGVGYAVREWTGEVGQFDPADEAGILPDFSTLAFKSRAEEGATVTETYTFKMRDGAAREQLFVFENGELSRMTTPEVRLEGVWPVSDFSDEPPAELFEIPVKTTLSIGELAEGIYIGTLSGDSYTTTGEGGSYTISTDIPPAEIAVIIRDGQLRLYSAVVVRAAGTVAGVEAPRSPTSTRIVSGTLPLTQTDAATVSADGDLAAQEEGLRINWDGDMRFTSWEVPMRESSYTCAARITLVDGVPTAEIAVGGKSSQRTATVPLRLAAQDGPEAPAAYSLWSNAGAGETQRGANDYYVMFPLPDCTVTELATCHFSGAQPGQLMLFGEDGSEYGPFDAVGRPGADGTPNAYWVAAVSIDLPAGRYAVADSDQASWSSSAATDGWGMATVRGVVK